MKIFFRSIAFLLPALYVLPAQAAPKAAQIGNMRIVEDTLWIPAFIVMVIFAYALMKLMKGGNALAYYGYTILLVSGITGFSWKAIGWYSRVAAQSKPEWFYSTVREGLESFTGLLLAVAFLLLLIGANKMSGENK